MTEGKPLDGLLPDQWALANPDKVLLNRDHENHQAQERKNEWSVGPPPPERVIGDWFV